MLECPEKLIKVLSRTPGIDHLVPQGKPLPTYDVYCASERARFDGDFR